MYRGNVDFFESHFLKKQLAGPGIFKHRFQHQRDAGDPKPSSKLKSNAIY
jgi:hypothetical protein